MHKIPDDLLVSNIELLLDEFGLEEILEWSDLRPVDVLLLLFKQGKLDLPFATELEGQAIDDGDDDGSATE